MDEKQALEQKYFEFQLLSQQLEAVQQQIVMLNQKVVEIDAIAANLGQLNNIEQDKKMWATVGGGIFVPAKTDGDYKQVLVNVGADTYVKKPVKESQKLVAEQTVQLQATLKTYEESFVKIQERLVELQTFFEQQQ